MTRVMATPAILAILVTAMIGGALPAGCSANNAGIGQQKMDAHASGLDAPAATGGGAGSVSDAAAAGGVTRGGGLTATGGTTQTGGAIVTGGASQIGGSTRTGGATAIGGASQIGGSTGNGGTTQTGGSTATGGASQSGGATTTGGASQTGGATQIGGSTATGGASQSGGATATGGASGIGGQKSSAGGSGGIACTGSGCSPKDAGSSDAGVDAAVTPTYCPQTPPANASSCGSESLNCFYDYCPSGGRTQAVCAGGLWTVQTAACGTVTCARTRAGPPTPVSRARCASSRTSAPCNTHASSIPAG